MAGVEFPVPLEKITKIEKVNHLRINVYGYEEEEEGQKEEIFPLYISSNEETDCVNLLLISIENKHHYCLIRNMSRLLASRTKHDGVTHFCHRCLHCFKMEATLIEHIKYCKDHAPQRIKMPAPPHNILQFEHQDYQHSVPYVIYADFESLIETMPTAMSDISHSSTTKTSHHEACGYAYVIVGPDGKSIKPVRVYRGPNAAHHFLKAIIAEKDELSKILTYIHPIVMTEADTTNYQKASRCGLCKKTLGMDKVRDHDHLTGKYRGALHSRCNLKYKQGKMIPVVFHNLKHYDAHLIMHALGQIKDHRLDVIATSMEKYISFSVHSTFEGVCITLRFIDSFQFLPASLGKLVGNLSADNFHILKENMKGDLSLLRKKGVYPYEYMDSFKRFKERCLPPISAFYSTLTGDGITDAEYAHAQTVWEAFDIANLGEYHDLYVKSDVLQLADVFQSFRGLCVQYYELDSVHLLTSPGLAWQACLKMCDRPLELLTDIDMHLFIERGIRGGVCMISKRWACANNHYLENYDASKPSSYIMYWDANNLYGWAMSQPLPYGDFQWVSPEISPDIIFNTPDDGTVGYILEVDLEYPRELHQNHNDYPLAPEKVKIKREDISPYCKNLLKNAVFIPTEKLLPNLCDKKNYVVYFRNLKFYLSQGLKLIKIHKVLKFRQAPWLKKYINFNTEKRKEAKSSFEKDFFKLLNNSVYGKTMENVRKHKDIQLVNTKKRSEKLVAAPSFHAFSEFTEDLVGVERVKKNVMLNRPLYVGFVILELSKILMYNFHYNYIKKKFSSKAQLLFTDTDSLTYEIQTQDIYKEMEKDSALFDTSDYPSDHFLRSDTNKKQIGCFKDELNSFPILEFVGLRPKMYSLLASTGEKKTAKGVCRHVVRKRLKHANYRSTLFTGECSREVQNRILSVKHQLYTVQINKAALSAYDDKRFVMDDGIHTLAYGHYKIKK